MRCTIEPDGTRVFEEVVVLELGHGSYSVVRQVRSGRTIRVLKKQLMPYDKDRVTHTRNSGV